jgi:hypothetical protein
MVDIDVGGEVKHSVSFSGKITIGSATKGGEVYFTFEPGDYQSQTIRAENAIRLLEYAKHLYYNPDSLPPIVVRAGGATAKVG